MKEFLILTGVILVYFIIEDLLIKFEIHLNKDLFYDLHKKQIDNILNKGDKNDD